MLQLHQALEALQGYHVVVASIQILKVILRHIQTGVYVIFSASSNTAYVFLQCPQKTPTGVTLPWGNHKSFSVQTLLLEHERPQSTLYTRRKTDCRPVIQLDYGFDNGGLPSSTHTKPILLRDYSIGFFPISLNPEPQGLFCTRGGKQ